MKRQLDQPPVFFIAAIMIGMFLLLYPIVAAVMPVILWTAGILATLAVLAVLFLLVGAWAMK